MYLFSKSVPGKGLILFSTLMKHFKFYNEQLLIITGAPGACAPTIKLLGAQNLLCKHFKNTYQAKIDKIYAILSSLLCFMKWKKAFYV